MRNGVAPAVAAERAKFAYGMVEVAGIGAGLLAFGPICVRLGRRRAFALMHIGAFIIVPLTCYLPTTYGQLLVLLPAVRFPDRRHPFRLRDILPGTVPHPSAGDGGGFLL